ncbi:unnamed protein product [Symbiodinium sp. CCMP2592]|nr:unnamed protein product [Symbiodinium sp. CCMP2592]
MSNSRLLLCSCVLIFVFAASALVGCGGESAMMAASRGSASSESADATQESKLVGQLQLPGEGGRRGVEVHAWVRDSKGGENQLWILPGGDGRFAREFEGEVTRVRVFAGREVHRIDGDDLPKVDGDGRVDLGVIDLRELLVGYQMRTRLAGGKSDGEYRAALWIGPPPTGPRGSLPSLGSAQFPTLELGEQVEWLLPADIRDVYFLVELPDGDGRGRDWRSGEQRVFGAFEASDFPVELVVD